MKDSVLKAHEQYVLSDRNLDAGLKGLVEGSDPYMHLKCMDILTRKGANLTKDERKIIDTYIANSEDKPEISLRHLLLQYDAATTPAEKEKLISLLIKDSTAGLDLEFDHSRPAQYGDSSAKESETAEKDATKGKPLMDAVDVQPEIEALYRKERSPGDFRASVLVGVDFARLGKEQFMELLVHMGGEIAMLRTDAFYEAFAGWMSKDYEERQTYEVEPDIMHNMTLEQLDKLLERIPTLKEDALFVEAYMQKKFWRELEARGSYAEQRKDLIAIYEFSKDLPEKLASLRSTVLFELLKNGVKQDLYEKEYFVEYIAAPYRGQHTKKKRPANPTHWEALLSRKLPGLGEELVLRKYLEHFFKQGEKMAEYDGYFDKGFLVALWERTRVISGEKVEVRPSNSQTLEKITADVDIYVCEHNKDTFNVGEDISIWVEIKNVPTLYIKVFEINTENYYRKHMKPFKSDISLDGLVASMERTVEYSKPPQLEFRDEIRLPELKGRRGLFVVELIGNGRSSRVVLKIGSLAFVGSPTIAGQVCYLVDENRKVCSGSGTAIWVDNEIFRADTAKGGRIIVPYVPHYHAASAILMHEGLSQLVNFERLEERYVLTCGFFLPPEAVITGNNATVAIRPRLLVNGRSADLALLKNIKCALFTANYVDDISTTKSYTDLKVSPSQEVLVPFQVPGQLKSLAMEFSAEVENVSKATTDKLSCRHEFAVQTHAGDNAIMELYLRAKDTGGYSVVALGKNGEPVPRVPMTLSFSTAFFRYPIKREGVTDDQGAINLGALAGVTSVTVASYSTFGSLHSSWEIPGRCLLNTPRTVDVLEGEHIEIPVAALTLQDRPYLRSYHGSNVLEDCSRTVRVETEPGALYSVLRIDGLSAGTYKLWGIQKMRVDINVHKGVYWTENSGYILKQNELLERRSQLDFVRIRRVAIVGKESGGATLQIQVESPKKDYCRVHAFLMRYLPAELSFMTHQLNGTNPVAAQEFLFQAWKNIYMSNRELSSEFRYCFDRREQKRFMGNTLERPKLVLKREYVRNTTTAREIEQAGQDFGNVEEEALQQIQQTQIDQKEQKHMKMSKKEGGYGKKMSKAKHAESAAGKECQIPIYQNFLGDPPLALYNLPVDPTNGTVSIELDANYASSYGCAYVVAVDRDSVAHYLQPLAGDKPRNRDLALLVPLDQKKGFCEMRTRAEVRKGESHTIPDVSSTDLQIIDSLEKVLLVIKEVQTLKHVSPGALERFGQLVRWDTMDEEEKNRFLSVQSSHELHLFLYKKDPEYFARVVRPYLVNKMEKSFIDHYLLGDKEDVIGFAESPALHAELNPLEESLLVETLLRAGNRDMAATFARRLRDALHGQRPSASDQNRVFDTVISLNMLKTNKDGIA